MAEYTVLSHFFADGVTAVQIISYRQVDIVRIEIYNKPYVSIHCH